MTSKVRHCSRARHESNLGAERIRSRKRSDFRKLTRKPKPMMYSASDRSLVSIARATAIAVVLCFGAASSAGAMDQSTSNTPAATTPPAKGEFDNNSTMDLASGQTVKTDCSVNWTAPDGK